MLEAGATPGLAPGSRPGRARRRSQGPHAPTPPGERPIEAPPALPEAEASPAAVTAPTLDNWAEEEGQVAESPPPPAVHHVEARIGREGLDRLRAKYAALLARMAERITDPTRLDELRTQAERLNPDTWVTDEEARIGIEQFDTLYETLRAPLGRRRRRRRGGARHRKGRARQDAQAPAGGTSGPDSKVPGESN
jgi:hypothetical protein